MEKSLRLASPRDFKKVYREGVKVSTRGLRLYSLRREGSYNRVGFSVKGSPTAVARNRLKRYLREAYRLHQNKIKRGLDLVVVALEPLRDKNFREVERALGAAFTKGRLWERHETDPSFVD